MAVAGGADDDATDTPITGPALDKASAAALEHTGEGRVTETEVGDEESYYEVEVTLDDGSPGRRPARRGLRTSSATRSTTRTTDRTCGRSRLAMRP